MNPLISIVSPVYKAEKIIPELVRQVHASVNKITPEFEIILVEDGGPDYSWSAIEEQCKKFPFVKGVKLSRNFGQHYAITAGLHLAKGDYVIVIDCDLQDNPVYFEPLYEKALQGFEIIYTYKAARKHSFFKNATAILFFYIFNYLIDNKNIDASKNIGSYSLLTRKAVEAYKSMKETHRHYLMILRMLGFRSTYIEIIHEKRFEGKSSYNFSKLVKHAINGITSQSDKLLRISVSIGFFIFILSILWTGVIVYFYFHTGLLNGYASIMATLLLGIGLILMSIGVAGIYIGKIFEQVKDRPLYIIEKQINL